MQDHINKLNIRIQCADHSKELELITSKKDEINGYDESIIVEVSPCDDCIKEVNSLRLDLSINNKKELEIR